MKKLIRYLLEKFCVIPRTEIVAKASPEYPNHEALPPGILHVVGGKNFQKWAYFKCPCGCGAPIMLSLSSARGPCWQVKTDWLDRATIEPSVRQTDGCFSHFWVKQGIVVWCKDTGHQYIVLH